MEEGHPTQWPKDRVTQLIIMFKLIILGKTIITIVPLVPLTDGYRRR